MKLGGTLDDSRPWRPSCPRFLFHFWIFLKFRCLPRVLSCCHVSCRKVVFDYPGAEPGSGLKQLSFEAFDWKAMKRGGRVLLRETAASSLIINDL